MNINGNTKPCEQCKYSRFLGINSQDTQLQGCDDKTGKCNLIEKINQEVAVEEKLQNEGSTCGSEYRAHYINRFMRRR